MEWQEYYNAVIAAMVALGEPSYAEADMQCFIRRSLLEACQKAGLTPEQSARLMCAMEH